MNSVRKYDLNGGVKTLLVVLSVLLGFSAAGDDEAGVAYFETHIRPLLVDHCYKCHSSKSKKIKGGLVLDVKDGWVKGGDTGPAIVPGDVEKSLLIESVRYENIDIEMPPKKKLPDHLIAKLEKWVEMGAPDPRTGEVTAKSIVDRDIDVNEGRKFWSFRPVKKVAVAKVAGDDWSRTEIDRFIYAKLDEAGLKPVGDADRAALLRRLSIDLTGLPPSEEELKAFLNDESADAYEKQVDRLLGSKRFGERWAQHWLDVARFAESSGGGRSLMFPHAWRYRDYVIDAFNSDKPYDLFVKEQLAGDLLAKRLGEGLSEGEKAKRKAELITAVGYLMIGPHNYELQDKETLRMEIVDEQINTMSRTFLGMTMGCARCHDHMFDPIPMKDYYALAGIFTSTYSVKDGNVSSPVLTDIEHREEVLSVHREHRAKIDALKQRLVSAKKTLSRLKKEKATGGVIKSAENEVKGLDQRLKTLSKEKLPARAMAMSVRDESKPGDTELRIRGMVRNKGEVVPRGFIQVACASDEAAQPEIVNSESGRLALAAWVASEENPLTRRVMVNRIWRQLFGRGIVGTPDNFGSAGQRPTHPELLEYLAGRFEEQEWSVKSMIREMVMSRVYQLSSVRSSAARVKDPRNELWSSMPHQRMDAEALRDTILFVSGRLDYRTGGLTIRKLSQYDLGYQFDTERRSVYVPHFRNSVHEIFKLFDAPNPNLVSGNRNTSTLPTQSLFMMNSPFVIEQAGYTADWLLSRPRVNDDERRIEVVYWRLFNRAVSDVERVQIIKFLAMQEREAGEDDLDYDRRRWTRVIHGLMGTLDFRYY